VSPIDLDILRLLRCETGDVTARTCGLELLDLGCLGEVVENGHRCEGEIDDENGGAPVCKAGSCPMSDGATFPLDIMRSHT